MTPTPEEEARFDERIKFQNPEEPETPVMARIRKLIALARDKANENEAANAAAFAQRLMAEHNIDEARLDPSKKDAYDLGAFMLECRPIHAAWHKHLVFGIAQNNNCYAVHSDMRHGDHAFRIIGRQRDAKVVFYLYHYLSREIDRLARIAWKSQFNPRDCEHYVASFAAGAVSTVKTRLVAQREESNQAAGNALVLRDEAGLKNAVATLWNGGRVKSATGMKSYNPQAYGQGVEAGKNLSVRHGVTTNPAPSRKEIG